MNHMSAGAEIERYPIFSQGFEKSRAAALHHSFVWERPALSVFSRQQSAQNTQHRHYTDKTRVLASGVKACMLGERLFQKEEGEIVWESCFSSLNVPFRKFDKPGPGLSNFLVTRPDFSFSYTWQAKLDFLSFSLFNLYMSMRMEAHWASPLPALAHQ